MPAIESSRNPLFRQWRRWVRHPEDPDCPWVPVEGWKQVEELARLRAPGLILHTAGRSRGAALKAAEVQALPARLLRRLSSHPSPQGVVAFFPKPSWTWRDITPRVVYADGLQDPGNLGSLLRTARASGLFSVLTGPGTVSCFNSKVIRASVGALFTVPFLEGIRLSELKEKGYTIWAASSRDGESAFQARFRAPLALVIGSEGQGLAPSSRKLADRRVSIPMQGGAESLNAAVAGGILLYQARCQADDG